MENLNIHIKQYLCRHGVFCFYCAHGWSTLHPENLIQCSKYKKVIYNIINQDQINICNQRSDLDIIIIYSTSY